MKIGIITMHHVENLGSVLQAYALQHKLDLMGHDAYLIDYRPKSADRKIGFMQQLFLCFINVLTGFSKQRFSRRLRLFKRNFFKCTPTILTRETIKEQCPNFDIYCTGSDQVWNPRYIADDTTYMLDFVSETKKCISYAASFATDNIPDIYVKAYSNSLLKYKFISVREKTGIDLVYKLTGKKSLVVCDPTILLTPEEWREVASEANIHIKGRYILVYLLGYMFDPRPKFYEIVRQVQDKLGCKVYFINGWIHDMKQKNSKTLFGVGPAEFISLFMNAEFVVTDSFHGTAFATIFNKPMVGVVKSANSGDGRLTTLLRAVGNEKAIVQFDQDFSFDCSNIDNYKADDTLLNKFRSESTDILTKALK